MRETCTSTFKRQEKLNNIVNPIQNVSEDLTGLYVLMPVQNRRSVTSYNMLFPLMPVKPFNVSSITHRSP